MPRELATIVDVGVNAGSTLYAERTTVATIVDVGVNVGSTLQ